MKKILLVASVYLPCLIYSQSLPLDDLVVYLPFDGHAMDQSGNGHHALVEGATLTIDRHGNPDAAYFFNGEDNLMTIPDDPQLHVSSVSLLLWVTFMDLPNNQRNFISKPVGNWTSDSYVFWYQNNGISGHIGNIDGAGYFSHYNWIPELEAWYFLAYTYDETSKMQTLYIDGEEVASDFTEPAIGWDDHPVMIGAESDIEEIVYWHYGKLDDILLFNRALSSQEISDYFNSYYAIGEIADNYLIASVQPNPTMQHAQLCFTLENPEVIALELHDALGTLIDNRTMNIPGSGRQSIDLDLENLTPGFYFVKMTAGDKAATMKILKAR